MHKTLRLCLYFLLASQRSHVSLRADEPLVRPGISSREVGEYVERLSRENRIVTDLSVQVENGDAVYSITSDKNPNSTPWVVRININDAVFRKAAQQFADDGFAMPIHRTATMGRKKFHSAVWVQDPSAEESLSLPAGVLPESGNVGVELESLREVMSRVMSENNIPGGTLAVSYKGKIIFERGFGYSSVEAKAEMPANANMRIASLSKSITAVAVLILMQEGKLSLDATLIDLLSTHPTHRFNTGNCIGVDPRWSKITIRNLLHHSGGWDRETSKDTVFQLAQITKSLKLPHQAKMPDMIRYQLTQPLDFDPGSRYAYSNIGYCLLGRVIEIASGQSYPDFVRDRILNPAGMTQTRLGKTKLADRANDEVFYHTQKSNKGPAIWDVAVGNSKGRIEMVKSPYGQWDLEVMDAHGGWTSTASDLVRFIDAIDTAETPLLTLESIKLMLEAPAFEEVSTTKSWYGLGWSVRIGNASGETNFWHTGSLAGTSTLMLRRWDGYSVAVLFNVDRTKAGERCTDVVDPQIHKALNKLTFAAD